MVCRHRRRRRRRLDQAASVTRTARVPSSPARRLQGARRTAPPLPSRAAGTRTRGAPTDGRNAFPNRRRPKPHTAAPRKPPKARVRTPARPFPPASERQALAALRPGNGATRTDVPALARARGPAREATPKPSPRHRRPRNDAKPRRVTPAGTVQARAHGAPMAKRRRNRKPPASQARRKATLRSPSCGAFATRLAKPE